MSREIEDGLGHGGLVATRAEREQDRRDQAERKRFKEIEAERALFRGALREIVRLRLATIEGTCAQRFDKAWQCATDALGSVSDGEVK